MSCYYMHSTASEKYQHDVSSEINGHALNYYFNLGNERFTTVTTKFVERPKYLKWLSINLSSD